MLSKYLCNNVLQSAFQGGNSFGRGQNISDRYVLAAKRGQISWFLKQLIEIKMLKRSKIYYQSLAGSVDSGNVTRFLTANIRAHNLNRLLLSLDW